MLPFVSSDYIAFCYFKFLKFFLNITDISIFNWIEILILHRLHILDFQMLSTETRNQGKKNGNVVWTYIWIRPMFLENMEYRSHP